MGRGRHRSGKNGGGGCRPQGGGIGDGGVLLSGGRAGIARRPRGGASGGGGGSGRGKMDTDRRMQGSENVFGYTYPARDVPGVRDDTTPGRVLLSCFGNTAPIEAFVDPSPCPDPQVGIPSYEYDPAVVGGVGLGFHGDEEEEMEKAGDAVASDLVLVGGAGLGFRCPEEEEEEGGEDGKGEEREEMLRSDSFSTSTLKVTTRKKNKGFLSIGRIRVYTEDTSSPEEEIGLSEEDESDDDDDNDNDDDDDRDILEGDDDSADDEEDSSSEGDSLPSADISDIDDEVATDYMEGIGGGTELLSTDLLLVAKLDSSDEDGFSKTGISSAKGGTKFGGLDLMNASVAYGLKKPKSKKSKGHGRYNTTAMPAADVGPWAMDDLLLLKDSRAALRKKKSPSHLCHSWPREGAPGKNSNVLGGKKKHRKELIALKRRQRMINRGVDLDQINYKLRQMVVNEVDMFSFQPMHTRDCSQVQRLASIYHLRSGCQGSGKKRFVTVSRTEKTSLPSTRDKLRLDKLLGASVDDAEDFVINQGVIKPLKQTKFKGSASREHQSAPAKLSKNGDRKWSGKQRLASFAERPVSFISIGVMQADPTEETADSNASNSQEMVTNGNSNIGAFELHTKGFGSKMMAKMGFVEGTGLGKEGQGMVQPIEVIKRPKSLGLGVKFEAESSIEGTEMRTGSSDQTSGIGAFEKHTKGFGSKMMAKMGFSPGTGLGKDGQGIINPLTAVKRPRSRGLGAKT